jgi:hypothetical protein
MYMVIRNEVKVMRFRLIFDQDCSYYQKSTDQSNLCDL